MFLICENVNKLHTFTRICIGILKQMSVLHWGKFGGIFLRGQWPHMSNNGQFSFLWRQRLWHKQPQSDAAELHSFKPVEGSGCAWRGTKVLMHSGWNGSNLFVSMRDSDLKCYSGLNRHNSLKTCRGSSLAVHIKAPISGQHHIFSTRETFIIPYLLPCVQQLLKYNDRHNSWI